MGLPGAYVGAAVVEETAARRCSPMPSLYSQLGGTSPHCASLRSARLPQDPRSSISDYAPSASAKLRVRPPQLPAPTLTPRARQLSSSNGSGHNHGVLPMNRLSLVLPLAFIFCAAAPPLCWSLEDTTACVALGLPSGSDNPAGAGNISCSLTTHDGTYHWNCPHQAPRDNDAVKACKTVQANGQEQCGPNVSATAAKCYYNDVTCSPATPNQCDGTNRWTRTTRKPDQLTGGNC